MKSLVRIILMVVMLASILFVSFGNVNADNPSGQYYHKTLANGKCVDNRFASASLAHQQGFDSVGKCPDVNPSPAPTQIRPTNPAPTNVNPTSISPTKIKPTKTSVSPTKTAVVITSTPVATNANVQKLAATVTAFPTATSTPNTLLKLQNSCPPSNGGNPLINWLFLVLGIVGTAFATKNYNNVKKLLGH